MGTVSSKLVFNGAIIISTWNLAGLVFKGFYDGATFHEALEDTPRYAPSFQNECGVSFKTFRNVAPS